jgi:hypothetical protein
MELIVTLVICVFAVLSVFARNSTYIFDASREHARYRKDAKLKCGDLNA